jgi:hypothetical protein
MRDFAAALRQAIFDAGAPGLSVPVCRGVTAMARAKPYLSFLTITFVHGVCADTMHMTRAAMSRRY